MKTKLSITVDRDIVDEIESAISEGSFRNKSHIMEYAVKQLLRGGGKE